MKKNFIILSLLMMSVLMISVISADVIIEPECGDGFVNQTIEGFEECDNGIQNQPIGSMDPVWNMIEGQGNRAYCSTDCEIFEVPGIWCGDDETNGDEECDGEPGCLDDCTWDNEGPDITNIHVEPEWPSCTEDSYIYATITDESGIPAMEPPFPRIMLHWKYNGHNWAEKSFTIQPNGDVYRIRVPTDAPTNAEEFKYYIEAVDNVGNIAFSGNPENDYEEFVYDCAEPTASVLGMPTSWVSQATATAYCEDDASGCNPASYLLYSSATEDCSDNVNDYGANPKTIDTYSWVCSYVEDNVGNFDFSGPFEFMVDGVDPTADANGPYECDEGQTITLDGSGSSDDESPGLGYAWDLDDDGQYDDSTKSNPEYDCIDGDATETVSLMVTDHVGNTDTTNAVITINNVDPTAETYDRECNEGETIGLVVDTTDPAGIYDLRAITWDTNGDGVYDDSSDYYCTDGMNTVTISVKADDGDGGIATDDAEITIYNVDPKANANGPYSCDEGESVTLTASATDVDTDTLTYFWSIDNAAEVEGQSIIYDCIDGYDEIDAVVRIIDEDGGEDTSETGIIIENVAPVVEAGDDLTVDEGQEFTIAPTFTDVGIEDTHTVEVDWGNGFEDSLTHTYCIGTSHVVTVRVTDDNGGVGEDTLTVTVDNVAPTITSTGGPYFGVIGDHLTFTAEAEDVCENQQLGYTWDFSPEGIVHAPNVASWNSRFDGMVVLTVSDGTDSVSVDVPVTIYDYKIELESNNCNLISVPLVPKDKSVLGVLNGVDPDSVWAYKVNPDTGLNEWYFHPGNNAPQGVGNLEEMIPGYGYYICTDEEDTIYQNGEKFYDMGMGRAMPPQVELTIGWNLIGHYGLNFVPKFMEKNNLAGSVLTDDLADMNFLGEDASPDWMLKPKVGYWAFITGENSLLYAPSVADYKDNTCSIDLDGFGAKSSCDPS